MNSVSWRTVAEFFALADSMKRFVPHGQNHYDFNSKLEQELINLSSKKITDLVNDPYRRKRFEQSIWIRRTIPLEQCWVWPKMGENSLASGMVPEVAGKLCKNLPPKLINMIDNPLLFLSNLPIIVFLWPPGIHNYERNDLFPVQYDIDDGSHRAVALWLANYRTADALVGRIKSF